MWGQLSGKFWNIFSSTNRCLEDYYTVRLGVRLTLAKNVKDLIPDSLKVFISKFMFSVGLPISRM